MNSRWRVCVGLLVSLLIAAGAGSCSSKEKKAFRDLIKEVSKQAKETETAGRALEAFSVLEQAQKLDSDEQKKGATKIYCKFFQMVRDGCNDASEVCDSIQEVLYGGSFPVFGMTICMDIVDDKCNEMRGKERQLQKICQELRNM